MDRSLFTDLIKAAGDKNVQRGEALAQRTNGFWDASPLSALCLVTPENTDRTAAAIRVCHKHRQPVVVQGGLTGTVRGQQAAPTEVAVSLEKMASISDFNPVGKTLVAEAGCTLQQVREFAEERGLLFPVDIGARGSCTIGGNIATNAGGMEVLRYGMMRNHVLGLEAVLADGTVLSSMNRMQKNNTGYDLKQLFIGSEGTLGIVTRAVLQLQPLPESCETALLACRGFDGVTAVLDSAQRELGDILTRFEVMDNRYYRIQTGAGHTAPLSPDSGWYALVEVMGFTPERDGAAFQRWLESLLERGEAADIVLAGNLRQRRALWRIREDFEVGLTAGSYFLYDVSLPVADMPAYLARLEDDIYARWPGAVFFILGHLADGNLHFFLSPGIAGDERALRETADHIVYEPLTRVGGSVSAEHGIGLDKKQWLACSRTPTEIRLMKTLKRTLDPHNLLNPGRLFDL